MPSVWQENGRCQPLKISKLTHYPTVKDAMTFVNRGMREDYSDWFVSGGDLSKIPAKTFLRLLSFTEVPIEKEEHVTQEPQPAKEIRTIRYHLGDEFGLASAGPDVGVSGTAPSLTGTGSGTMTIRMEDSPGITLLKALKEGQFMAWDSATYSWKAVDPPNSSNAVAPAKKPKAKKK